MGAALPEPWRPAPVLGTAGRKWALVAGVFLVVAVGYPGVWGLYPLDARTWPRYQLSVGTLLAAFGGLMPSVDRSVLSPPARRRWRLVFGVLLCLWGLLVLLLPVMAFASPRAVAACRIWPLPLSLPVGLGYAMAAYAMLFGVARHPFRLKAVRRSGPHKETGFERKP